MPTPGKTKIGVIVDNELNSDKRVLREIKILRDAGYEIFVLCFGFKPGYSDPVSGVKINRIRISKKLKDILLFFQNLVPVYEWIWAKRIKEHISAYDPDIIHVHDLYMAKAGRQGIRKSGRKIPMILDLHENYPFAILAYNWTKGFLRRSLSRPGLWQKKEKKYLSYADGIIVLSKEFMETLREKYPTLSGTPFAAFPNVPDLSEKESSTGTAPNVKIEEGVSVVLYFGIVAERRGIFDVLEVFDHLVRENHPSRLLIIGPIDKKDRERFFNEINTEPLNEKVTYIPWIEASELPAYLKISDICLAPFKKNPHHDSGVANKVFDYMLGRKPVIASDCKPQKNLIEKYNCGIVYKNNEELKEAIIRISEDPKLRLEMGENGYRAIIEEYNIEAVKSGMLNLYNKLSGLMKTLVLVTSNFPFGTGEPFIEPELPYLVASFDRVIIIAQNASSPRTRDIPSGIKVFRYNPVTSISGFLSLPILTIRNSGLILSVCRKEISFRRKIEFTLNLKQRLFLIRKIIKAIQLRDFITSVLASERLDSGLIFYSFWMNSGAHAIALLDDLPCVKISRAHASDLYEEKSPLRFLPLLKFTSDRLNSVIFPSEHGLKYFKAKTRIGDGKLRLSRLGVNRLFPLNSEKYNPDGEFTIVSCSNLIPLKRIDLIIKSLELINSSNQIRWIHFGDGRLRNELEELAGQKLGSKDKLKWEFMGQVPNREVQSFYSSNRVDLFLNTSSTEGTPVSIMEAQSYGIPVIATDVGAVSEMIDEETGSLLPVDFEPADLARLIRTFMNKPARDAQRMHKLIIEKWETRYNAAINYPDFISQVISIFDSSISSKPE